jgi:hypothetical protein
MANPPPKPELLYEERTAMATKAEHERRLKLARSVVRDARELLTSSSGVKLAFDYELLRLYAENRISHSPALLLLIAIVGFAATLWTGDYYALVSIPLTHGHPRDERLGLPEISQAPINRWSCAVIGHCSRRSISCLASPGCSTSIFLSI